MKIGPVDLDHEILVVAEIGNNHEGDVRLAERMIAAAARTGAKAVKFQTIRAQELVSPGQTQRFAQLKSFELSNAEFERLSRVAADEGVVFLSTPFDLESALFLNGLVPAFKIASSDNTFLPLLEYVAGFGKPIMLSGGLADLATLRTSVDTIRAKWREMGAIDELAVLHCVTSYPTPPEDANLSAIPVLRDAFQCTAGYSDHVLGIEAAAAAAALGARVIEKHFTLDKNQSGFRDHQIAADPQEFAELVRRVNLIEILRGDGTKAPRPSESGNIDSVRRSIVARHSLPEGHMITWNDLRWIRPGGGLPPGQEARLLGRKLLRPVQESERIGPEDVK